MSIALVAVLIYGIRTAGGMEAVIANAKALPGHLSLSDIYDVTTGSAMSYGGVIAIISTLAWGLGYFGMPHILLRFMAIEDEKKLTLSRRIASVWVVISMALSIIIGVVGLAVSKAGVIDTLTGSDSETIIVKIASALSTHGIFPALVAGIILAGILAATMSTADSQLLAASSSVSENIVSQFFGIKLDTKKSLGVARLVVVLISVIAIFLARDPSSSVFKIVSFAWAGFGAAFGPVMLLALFWKKSNKHGALAGMVTGGVMVFVWKYLVRPMGGAFDIYELLPAFLVALAVNIIVSIVTHGADEALVAEYEKSVSKRSEERR